MKHMAGVSPTATTPEAAPRKRHILFDHPILTEIVMFVLFIVISNLVIYGIHYFGYDFEGVTDQLVNSGVLIFSSIVVTLLFQLYFHKEFDGMFGWSNLGILLSIPTLLFVVSNLFSFETMQFNFLNPEVTVNPIPACLVMALAPGIAEELMFRGIPASNWMRTAEDEGTVLKCTFITSIIFGLVHSLNALSGAAISSTIFQVFYATCLGIIFCAIFLRTGSMWPTMIAHTLIDFSGFLFMDMDNVGIITDKLVIGPSFYIAVGCAVAFAVIGLIMLRGSKREEILQLWYRKWHKAEFGG